MSRRPLLPLAVASLLFGLTTLAVWFDSSTHFTTARTPTIHRKFIGFVVSQGRMLIMEGSSMPRSFHWSRRVQVGPVFQRTRTEFAGFGYGRSVDGSYIMFPLSSVILLAFVAAIVFWCVRRINAPTGFEVVR